MKRLKSQKLRRESMTNCSTALFESDSRRRLFEKGEAAECGEGSVQGGFEEWFLSESDLAAIAELKDVIAQRTGAARANIALLSDVLSKLDNKAAANEVQDDAAAAVVNEDGLGLFAEEESDGADAGSAGAGGVTDEDGLLDLFPVEGEGLAAPATPRPLQKTSGEEEGVPVNAVRQESDVPLEAAGSPKVVREPGAPPAEGVVSPARAMLRAAAG